MKRLKNTNIEELTRQEFQRFTDMKISDELAENIKNNLVRFFELLLTWSEQDEEMKFCTS